MDPALYPGLGRGRVALTGTTTVDGSYVGLILDCAGTFSLNFSAAATLGSQFQVAVYCTSGTVTLDPNGAETIQTPTGSVATLALTAGQGVYLSCDGTGLKVALAAGLAPAPSATIITSTIQAATSAGITVQNSTPATVMTIGSGPGTGVAFAGGITSAAITATSASGITTLQASTQDAIALLGRAGGTSSYVGTITPTTLTASRTYTMPDATTTIAGLAVAQTFSANQTFSGNISQTGATTFSTGTGAVSLNGAVTASSTIAQTVTLSGAGTVTGTNVALTFQNTGGTNRAIISVGTANPSGASTAATTGIEGRADLSSSATVTPSGDFTGVNGQARFNSGASSGTVGAAYGVQGSINNGNASTTITSAYAFFAPAPTRTGTITTYAAYGTAALNSGEYAFRSLGTGLVSIGDTTDSTSTTNGALVVSGGGGFAKQVSALNYLATMGTITSAEPVFDSTVTWNSGGTTFDGIKLNVTNTASATASRLINLQTGGTTFFQVNRDGTTVVGSAALATGATDGFLYIPTCAGTPTGAPTAYTGRAPIIIDSTNNKLYFYSGGAWRDAGP